MASDTTEVLETIIVGKRRFPNLFPIKDTGVLLAIGGPVDIAMKLAFQTDKMKAFAPHYSSALRVASRLIFAWLGWVN